MVAIWPDTFKKKKKKDNERSNDKTVGYHFSPDLLDNLCIFDSSYEPAIMPATVTNVAIIQL